MSWTDERVERLSRLWLDGRSASQIATELGGGVSRNAVIGKVHRLGLSGRATVQPAAVSADVAIALAPQVAAEPVAVRAKELPRQDVKAPAPAMVPPAVADEAATSLALSITFDLPMRRIAKDVVIPRSDRVTILELGATMCRWPLGDPTSAEFRFCGCRAVNSMPYCTEHARVAFQPVADRRRVERMARTG